MVKTMKKTKKQWIDLFRQEAQKAMPNQIKQSDQKRNSQAINKAINKYLSTLILKTKQEAAANHWSNDQILKEILLITYASYIVMLEYRNKVWPYDYMAFARRIGELWEPFCKLTFEYPIKKLEIIKPHDFEKVQNDIKQKTRDYISNLSITDEECLPLKKYYELPWSLVDSGGIELGLDLHFEQNNIHYNCDFKSGFSSNEKGNTNRLLLVGSIYHSLWDNEKTLLFVRQEEDKNNHYLQTLKNSPYWSCYCASSCYSQMEEFTGFNLRDWIDKNIDWINDFSDEFKKHIEENNLAEYLTW